MKTKILIQEMSRDVSRQFSGVLGVVAVASVYFCADMPANRLSSGTALWLTGMLGAVISVAWLLSVLQWWQLALATGIPRRQFVAGIAQVSYLVSGVIALVATGIPFVVGQFTEHPVWLFAAFAVQNVVGTFAISFLLVQAALMVYLVAIAVFTRIRGRFATLIGGLFGALIVAGGYGVSGLVGLLARYRVSVLFVAGILLALAVGAYWGAKTLWQRAEFNWTARIN